MTIYGPDRNKRHVFYDGKRVAPSPLSSKTSTFDPPNPRNRRFAREGRALFFNPRFCSRGTSLFGPTWVQYSKTRHFTREVRRFFVKPSKTPNITDENTSKGVQKGNSTHHTWQRPDLFWTLKSEYYIGKYNGKLISGRLPNKKRR